MREREDDDLQIKCIQNNTLPGVENLRDEVKKGVNKRIKSIH